MCFSFFFTATATTEIYTLSLHDALPISSHADLIALADVRAKMEREVMGGLRELAKFEMPKKVVLIERDFTIDSGELTPSLKVKRRVVEKNYRAVIDRAYADADAMAAAIES